VRTGETPLDVDAWSSDGGSLPDQESAMSTTTTVPSRIDALTRWTPQIISVLRIVVALLFIEHGTQKLFGFPAPPPTGLPAMFTLIWFAAVLEFAGGLLLLVGLFTRVVAFVLSGEMAFAYWMAHAPRSPFPILNGGDAAILYCFVFLTLAVLGAGPWSIDRGR
jgi:putative oxidoreductase